MCPIIAEVTLFDQVSVSYSLRTEYPTLIQLTVVFSVVFYKRPVSVNSLDTPCKVSAPDLIKFLFPTGGGGDDRVV